MSPLLLFVFLALPPLGRIDMKNTVVRGPVDAMQVGSRFYILDRPSKSVVVVDNSRYLFYFGRSGQGPGEFEHPVGMCEADGKVYTIDSLSGKINVFDLEGKVLNSFHLRGSELDNIFISDLLVRDGQLIVAYSKGLTFLRVFDLNGKLVQEIVKPKEEYPMEVSNLYELCAGGAGEVIVFSQLDGSISFVSLKTGKISHRQLIDFPSIASDLADMRKERDEEASAPRDAGQTSVVNLSYLFPLQTSEHGYKVMLRKPNPNHTFSVACYNQGKLTKEQLNQPQTDDKLIFLKTFNNLTLLGDVDGNLYLERSLL